MHNSHMRRYLESSIKKDLKEKIVILSGPRQVGKTTLSQQITPSHSYLNFDSSSDRKIIHKEEWNRDVEMVIFDELHKMKNWKSWIKGIYDTEGIPPSLLVTGSARIETYRKGGDSLAGRYFSFRLHPLTVKEICAQMKTTPKEALDSLLNFGGFPEPFLKQSERFAKRWRRTHVDTIVRQELLDLENVRDIKSIEILIDLLRGCVGSPTSFTSLAQDLQVSVHTVKHWLQILESLYVIFPVRPYHKNISRSLLKEPKYYLFDVGAVEAGLSAKIENAVALALLRDLHLLEDTTGSRVSLHYLRDKEKNEVDFLTVVDHRPTCMIEVKVSDDSFSKSLFRFFPFLKEIEVVQLVYNLKRKKTRHRMRMIPVHEFLLDMEIV